MPKRFSKIREALKDYVRRRPALYFLANFGRVLKRQQLIFVDYSVDPQPRYGYGKPPHRELYNLLARDRAGYRGTLERFLEFREPLCRIAVDEQDPREPCWANKWLSGLDTVALYCLVAMNHPQHYLEVGSGYSTKVARRAVRDHELRTQIISIDPQPRAEIDSLCDRVIRQPLEKLDLAVFDMLVPGDILFIDSSHRAFTNSDVAVLFLEVLPRLQPGVLVELHDILLPYDYPPQWRDRYYSEQYLLAAALLAQSTRFRVALPNAFISQDAELSALLAPLWDHPALTGLNRPDLSYWSRRGASFWMRTT